MDLTLLPITRKLPQTFGFSDGDLCQSVRFSQPIEVRDDLVFHFIGSSAWNRVRKILSHVELISIFCYADAYTVVLGIQQVGAMRRRIHERVVRFLCRF